MSYIIIIYITQYEILQQNRYTQNLNIKMHIHSPIYTEVRQLNSFSLSNPIYCSIYDKILVIDTNKQLYKYGKNIKQQLSMQIDNLQLQHYTHTQTNEIDTQQQLKMDLQYQIYKCSSHLVQIDQFAIIEILIVLNQINQIKIWYKIQGKHSNFKLCQLPTQINANKIIDYCINTNNKQFIIQLLHQKIQINNTINVQISKLCIKLTQMDIKWQQISNYNITYQNKQIIDKLQLLDNGNMILSGNQVIGVSEKYNIKLQGCNKIESIDANTESIAYGGKQGAFLYNRLNEVSKCISNQSSILSIKYINNGKIIAIITQQPMAISILSSSGSLLWSIPLPSIQSPLLVHSINSQMISMLDSAYNKIYTITKQSILKSMPNIVEPTQQLKLHQATINTLKHRLQILKTLQTYLMHNDMNSVFRFLNNCDNNPMLNDGLHFISNYFSAESKPLLQYEMQIVKLSFKLVQQSKYQSHFQNGLQIMLNSTKRIVKNNHTYQPKIWQQYCKLLKQIVDNKKIKKLKQQEKNKKIFQLTYEFVHTANSHILRN